MNRLPQKKRTPKLQVVTNRGTSWLLDEGDAVLLAVVVVAQATRDRIMGIHEGLLKIQLAAPAEHPRVNAALVAFVAERLGIPKAQIALMTGGTNRHKRLRLMRVTYQAALLRLSPSPA